MSKLIINLLKNIVTPLVILYILFATNTFLGIAGVLGYIAYMLYKKRESLYAYLAKLKYYEGDIKNAIKWYKKAAELEGSAPDSTISYSYLLLKDGQISEAENKIDKFLSRISVSRDKKMVAKSIKALIIWKKGDLDSAIELFENVLEEVETSNIYGSMGYLLILKGDLNHALEFNLKAYEYNNSHDVILDNLGQTYYLLDNFDKSKEIYEELMGKKIKPTFPEAYYNYGLLLNATGERAKAIENMKKALDYDITFVSTITHEEIKNKISEISE